MGFSLKSVSKAFKGVTKGVKKAIQRIPEETRNFSNSIVRTGTAIGAAPFQIVGGVATQGIQAIAPALSAATGVLQDNPLLAGALGSAIGMPGLGGMLGGGDSGGGGFAAPVAAAEPEKASVPVWVWIAGGGGLILAFLLFGKKKA